MMDLRKATVIAASDLAECVRKGLREVWVSPNSLVTLSACEYARANELRFRHDRTNARELDPKTLLDSAESLAARQEMVGAGQKLWDRQYVDGSGGNISARLNDDYLICTPAFCSKRDLTLDCFALVNMKGDQVAGTNPRSSEILLHVEIYRAVPRARAIIHCHPPHVMAYAITGTIPAGSLTPEHEVFVGRPAMAAYETPGTREFAHTVLPYVQDHNTVLLRNHGMVCWADTVTHAEWIVEVMDTHCRTLLLASHLNAALSPIPDHKVRELLELKRELGLPDPRHGETD